MRTHRPTRDSLSLNEARRAVLAAQGLAGGRLARAARRADIARTIRRLGLIQIDSVNVLVRSHYLPLFSRLGPYDREWLDRSNRGRSGRTLFEYWGHEASLLPLEQQPLLRWRMQRALESGEGMWRGVARFGRERTGTCREILAQIAQRGPLGVSDLEDGGGRRKGGWWGWSEGKVALEWLFWTGQVTTHSRRGFERIYALPERVLPPDVLASPTPPAEDAQRELVRIAARALGVATERDLRDYYRLPVAEAQRRIAELVEAGELRSVRVEGWRQMAYVPIDVRVPRRSAACALLSPFDSLVWSRERLQRLFGFHYRIEIYTPQHKRVHGYYVLPFLLGERLVARVDLKSDRAAGRLRVIKTHYEPDVDKKVVDAPLRGELRLLAGWLGLETR
jgi:uncharacterized protein YcaQ